jgi:hypothetical protein
MLVIDHGQTNKYKLCLLRIPANEATLSLGSSRALSIQHQSYALRAGRQV